jgi:hypothetical protein
MKLTTLAVVEVAMITVLHTHSASWAESARLALEGEGIETAVLDPYSSNTLGLAGSIRIAIVDAKDQQRAMQIIAMLQPVPVETSASWWWHKRAALAFGAAILLIYLGTSMAESQPRIGVSLAVSALGAVSLVIFVVFLLLGYRADRRAAAAAIQRTESPRER